MAPNAVAGASVNAQARPEDGFSSAALLTAVFGVVPASIPLGIAGLVRTKGGGRTGRGRAVVSLIVSGLWIILLAAGFVYDNSSGLPLTPWSNPNTVPVDMADLRSNQCVTFPVVRPGSTWSTARSRTMTRSMKLGTFFARPGKDAWGLQSHACVAWPSAMTT